jgi:4-hydroxythreonine-4-phosphate dehydrogenase
MGVRASGPYPADTVFAAALAGKHDAVVAMYHDQGLIAVKTVEHDGAVNATLGLPFLRTSPAHGTAFDIAGRGKARCGSMRAAVEMAVRAARLRLPWNGQGYIKEGKWDRTRKEETG